MLLIKLKGNLDQIFKIQSEMRVLDENINEKNIEKVIY